MGLKVSPWLCNRWETVDNRWDRSNRNLPDLVDRRTCKSAPTADLPEDLKIEITEGLITMANRHRTITFSDERRSMVALCAAHLDTTAERFIQSCLTAGMLALAAEDPTFARMLCRAAGVSWRELQNIDSMDLSADGFGR
jgi:hypothetical protein